MSLSAWRDAWRQLSVTIETCQVEHLSRRSIGSRSRTTAVIRLRGIGRTGFGEDVTFQQNDLLTASPRRHWRFSGALGEFSEWLDGIAVFERPPQFEAVLRYRRWAYEAAALDLALRQADANLSEIFRLQPQPVQFVVSPPAGFTDPPEGIPLKIEANDLRPGLPVEIVDFKQQGERTLVERAFDLYASALFEDPPHIVDGARVSWDIGITCADDVRRLPARPAAINIKPARIGGVERLLELYDYCWRERIQMYGGGQDELGPGRAQIQLLAAHFHPDAPNDVAPAAHNDAGKSPRRVATPSHQHRGTARLRMIFMLAAVSDAQPRRAGLSLKIQLFYITILLVLGYGNLDRRTDGSPRAHADSLVKSSCRRTTSRSLVQRFSSTSAAE